MMDDHVLMYIVAQCEALEDREYEAGRSVMCEDLAEYHDVLCCLHLDADTQAARRAEYFGTAAPSDDPDIPF